MMYWAMVSPLAYHSRGHNKLPPDNPLHGLGCTLDIVWKWLNDVHDSAVNACYDVITSQYTISMAFDSWQEMIKKIWQSYSCSSNYLRGVAAFMKKDKAILLPIHTVLKSLSGILFCITSRAYLDAYSTIFGGEMINVEGGQQSSLVHKDPSVDGNDDNVPDPLVDANVNVHEINVKNEINNPSKRDCRFIGLHQVILYGP
jgi:hypothetical protein